jgi:hypothetical protein
LSPVLVSCVIVTLVLFDPSFVVAVDDAAEFVDDVGGAFQLGVGGADQAGAGRDRPSQVPASAP